MQGTGEIPHILVVDDEAAVLRLFQIMLGHFGFRASGFQVPEEAITVLAADPDAYDLIICDYRMPGMDGYAFARTLRQFDQEIPIVLSTGYARGQLDQGLTGELGIVGCVNKPIQKADLYAAVLDGLACRIGDEAE